MKIPRDLSGHELIAALCRHWGHKKVNQVGSHVILQTRSQLRIVSPFPHTKQYASEPQRNSNGRRQTQGR